MDGIIDSSCRTQSSPRLLFLLFAAFIGISFCGCQAPQKSAVLPSSVESKTPVALAAGDVLRLSFPGAPELNQSQKVRSDGKISLPLIGEVDAGGKRMADFQAELTRLYKPQLQNSEVVVSLESSVSTVFVSGAVKNPSKLAVDKPLTVFDAIMEAGGFGQFANQTKVHLIRRVNGKHLTQFIDLSAALRGEPMPAVFVKGGDVIYVPERAFNF